MKAGAKFIEENGLVLSASPHVACVLCPEREVLHKAVPSCGGTNSSLTLSPFFHFFSSFLTPSYPAFMFVCIVLFSFTLSLFAKHGIS